MRLFVQVAFLFHCHDGDPVLDCLPVFLLEGGVMLCLDRCYLSGRLYGLIEVVVVMCSDRRRLLGRLRR